MVRGFEIDDKYLLALASVYNYLSLILVMQFV